MDTKYYIANWKSNKNKQEALTFLQGVKEKIGSLDLNGKVIIIAPPFHLLDVCREYVDKHELPISLASQNVSSFPPGAYTGEINAKQLKEFVEYSIVGHSERLKYMHETDVDIENKVREAISEGIIVVQCVQNENSKVHKGVSIIAYEPPSAIGTGNPDDPEHIAQVFESIVGNNSGITVLYGGSVKPENIAQFDSVEQLSGYLVGGASLESESFLALLNG